MNTITSFVKSLFSIRSNHKEQPQQPEQHNVDAKIIPFGVSGKENKKSRGYDYRKPEGHYGQISLSQIKELHSDRIKHAIISYGAWSSLATAFSAYQKTRGRYARESDMQAFGHAINLFHGWNSALDNPLNDDQVEDIAIRLTSPVVAKDNDSTDAIRANALRCTVQEVREKRLARAKVEQEKRQDAVKGFVGEVWSGNGIIDDPDMNGDKAMAKAESTLEWMALQDWIEPAEILLASEDIKILASFDHEYGGYEGSRALDEQLASNEMMAAGMVSGK